MANPPLNDWVTTTWLRMLQERMPCEVVRLEKYAVVVDSEVYIVDTTLVGLVDKIVAWAQPGRVITYRDVLMHSGSYHAFVGMQPEKWSE